MLKTHSSQGAKAKKAFLQSLTHDGEGQMDFEFSVISHTGGLQPINFYLYELYFLAAEERVNKQMSK